MNRNLVLFMILLVFPSAIYAGGYRVSLQGVRQAALGAQGVMLSHDASVAFFNPAALAFVDSKLSVAVGGFGVAITNKYQNLNTLESVETDNPLGTPIYAAASYKPTENLAIGLSFTTPFGSTIEWGDEWSGRYVTTRTELKSYFFQPTVSYKFNDWFGIGVGYIIARGSVNMQRSVAAGNTDATLEVESTEGKGSGFNVGAFVKPTERLTVGVSYRSKVEMEVEDGDVMWSNAPASLSGNMPFAATNFNAKLPLPYEALFGLSYQFTNKLTLFGEIGSVGWEEYKNLNIDLYNADDVYSTVSRRNYFHTFNYSIGGEYLATSNIAVRLSYKYDNTPSPEDFFNPETPTTDYHAFNAGLGFDLGSFNVDVMGEYLKGVDRSFDNVDTNFSGELVSNGFIFGVGLSYKMN